MNIKKQISRLYFYETVSGLKIVDAVWVFFLLQRGFSIAQAGIAEGVFHLVSMCFEIPSGMVSDTIGRKNTLMLAGLVSACSSVLMALPGSFLLILAGMGLNAVSYNLVSGTREALTYDSLLEAGEEENYLRVSSHQEFLYETLYALSSLLSIVTVRLGYRGAYLLSAFQGALCICVASGLKEAAPFGRKDRQSFSVRETAEHYRRTAGSLGKNPRVAGRMAFSGFLSAVVYVDYMFLQEHLTLSGLKAEFLGIPLLLVSLLGTTGTLLAPRTQGVSMRFLYLTGGILTGVSVVISGGSTLPVIIAGAGAAQCLSGAVVLRTEAENQKAFSSESRATFVSAGSMVYSVFMTLLSPLAGALAGRSSVPVAFCMMGAVTAAVSVLTYGTAEKRRGRKGNKK